ncbi:MAG: type II secretion system F family protein [Nanoarchaeota archaeon]|nr:type II secretion system F family protein [Nanoarchaeota archaeon]
MSRIKKKTLFFSEEYEELLKKSMLGYDLKKFSKLCYTGGFLGGALMGGYALMMWFLRKFPIYYVAVIFAAFFIIFFLGIKQMPIFSINGRKALLESDLLYSARHLLIKIESGSSLVNSIESVSLLKTKSSVYFKQIIFDISLGMPVEDALRKSMEYSPSKAYTKILEEIESSLKTGSDLQKSLKATLEDLTRQHFIQIEEYGKKLNPMSMFYMIMGTILPSLGSALMVVGASIFSSSFRIESWIFYIMGLFLLIVQIFFVLAFRSLKPAVME